MELITIIRLSSIGDVVLSTACLKALIELKPHAKIFWIGRAPSLGLIQKAYPDVRVYSVDDHDQVKEILKKSTYVFDLQGTWKTYWLCRMNSKKFFRIRKDSLRRSLMVLLAQIFGRKTSFLSFFSPAKPQYERMLETLKPIFHSSQWPCLLAQRPCLGQSKKNQKSILGVSGGASYQTKKAKPEKFVEILRFIHNEGKPWEVFFFGDQNDRVFTDEVIKGLPKDLTIKNYVGQISLKEVVEILSQDVSCVLGHDSSLAHIAESIGCPSIVLFGPTVEEFGFSPWQKDSQPFSIPLGCRPCSKHGKKECSFGDKLCFELISESIVAKKIASVLFS